MLNKSFTGPSWGRSSKMGTEFDGNPRSFPEATTNFFDTLSANKEPFFFTMAPSPQIWYDT